MKSLAEFVMRGRLQALLVVVIGASSLMFSWISAAVVALVTLRKGAGAGAWLLFWALLPAGSLLYVFGDSGPLVSLLGTAALAWVLRVTISLPLTLIVSVAVGLVTGLAMVAFGGEALEQMLAYFAEFLANLEQQLGSDGAEIEFHRPTAVQVAGMLGLVNALVSTLCLLLARWWQAVLYNPGGFASEFRALRLTPAITLGLLLPGLLLGLASVEYRSWGVVFLVPLTFAGLALVHARAAVRGSGGAGLTVFYVLWLIFDPVKLLVVFAAIADSWMDFRRRWSATGIDRRDDDDRE